MGSAFLLAAVIALASAAILGPWALLAAAVLTGISIGLDKRTYGYAYRHHGILFGLQFTVLHLMVTLTSAVAASIGILQGLLFPRMTRRLYRVENPA